MVAGRVAAAAARKTEVRIADMLYDLCIYIGCVEIRRELYIYKNFLEFKLKSTLGGKVKLR
jgi:hypothetical protein